MAPYIWNFFIASVLCTVAEIGWAVPAPLPGSENGQAYSSASTIGHSRVLPGNRSALVLATIKIVSQTECPESSENGFQTRFINLVRQNNVTNKSILKHLNEKCNDRKTLELFENHFSDLSQDGRRELGKLLEFNKNAKINPNPLFGVQRDLRQNIHRFNSQQIKDYVVLHKITPNQFRNAVDSVFLSASHLNITNQELMRLVHTNYISFKETLKQVAESLPSTEESYPYVERRDTNTATESSKVNITRDLPIISTEAETFLPEKINALTIKPMTRLEYCTSSRNSLKDEFENLIFEKKIKEYTHKYLVEKCDDKEVINRFRDNFGYLEKDGMYELEIFLKFIYNTVLPGLSTNPLLYVEEFSHERMRRKWTILEELDGTSNIKRENLEILLVIERLIPKEFKKAAEQLGSDSNMLVHTLRKAIAPPMTPLEYCSSSENPLQAKFQNIRSHKKTSRYYIQSYLEGNCNNLVVLNRFEDHYLEALSEHGVDTLEQFLYFDRLIPLYFNRLSSSQNTTINRRKASLHTDLGENLVNVNVTGTEEDIKDLLTIRHLIPQEFRKVLNIIGLKKTIFVDMLLSRQSPTPTIVSTTPESMELQKSTKDTAATPRAEEEKMMTTAVPPVNATTIAQTTLINASLNRM